MTRRALGGWLLLAAALALALVALALRAAHEANPFLYD